MTVPSGSGPASGASSPAAGARTAWLATMSTAGIDGDLGLEPQELLELLRADLGRPSPPARRARGMAGVRAPSSGWCSPDGVQRLLTRVSWQEIRSRPAKQGSGIRLLRLIGEQDPHPATTRHQQDGCAGSACCATTRPRVWSLDGGHSRVRHRRVRSPDPRRRGIPDEAGDHIAAHEVRINDRIRAREVRLIGADGAQLGVQPLPEALAHRPRTGARSGRGRRQGRPARLQDHGLRQVRATSRTSGARSRSARRRTSSSRR